MAKRLRKSVWAIVNSSGTLVKENFSPYYTDTFLMLPSKKAAEDLCHFNEGEEVIKVYLSEEKI